MRVIIIGGIAAGTSAAAKAKRSEPNLDIVIYEKGEIISFGGCGLPYYIGNMFDNHERMIARTPEQLKKTGIDVKTMHEVIKVNPEQKTVMVKNLSNGVTFEDKFDQLVITTGSYPIMPPFKNRDLKNIYTLKNLTDGNAIKSISNKAETQNIVIIGAGFIGLEVADMMLHKGKNVRLIQLDPHVMPEVFDDEFTELIEKELIDKGVKLHLNETVSGFEGTDTVKKVVTDKGTYDADLVIVCTGVRPNTAFLNNSGIITDKGAVVINKFGQTNYPYIYSAGDCATIYHIVKNKQVYIPLATGANKLGRIVGQNIAGDNFAFEGSLGSSCLQVIELEAAKTGISEKEAKELGINYSTVLIKDKNQTDYYPEQHDIQIKIVYNTDSKIILGAQLAGKKGAVLRTDIFAAAIYAKMTTTQLGFLDLCYAPPFARTWDAVNTAANAAK